MADCILSDGREITFDLSKFTIAEYRLVFSDEAKPEEGDAIMAKACGMTAEEVDNLPYSDYRKLAFCL